MTGDFMTVLRAVGRWIAGRQPQGLFWLVVDHVWVWFHMSRAQRWWTRLLLLGWLFTAWSWYATLQDYNVFWNHDHTQQTSSWLFGLIFGMLLCIAFTLALYSTFLGTKLHVTWSGNHQSSSDFWKWLPMNYRDRVQDRKDKQDPGYADREKARKLHLLQSRIQRMEEELGFEPLPWDEADLHVDYTSDIARARGIHQSIN